MYYPPYKNQIQNQNIISKDITPFAPIILKAHYNNFDPVKIAPFLKQVMGANVKTDTNWSIDENDLNQKFDDNDIPHLNPIFKDFYDWLNPIVMDIIFNKFEYSKHMKYAIYNSWINLHIPGGSTEAHNHGPSVVAVSTYLYMPKDGGYIEFYDPLEYHKAHLPRVIDDQQSNWKVVPTVTGDVILFPGWLKHRTQKNKSNENRWVLTTNYICTNIPIKA